LVISSVASPPRPPDEVPRAFYENINKEKEAAGATGAFAELNIGPPPSFAPPVPPSKNK